MTKYKRLFLFFFSVMMLAGIGCSSLLYYPSHEHYFDPKKAGVEKEDVWLGVADGAKIHGWYFKNKTDQPAKALIVFFHGNAENLTSHFANLLWILEQGYDYFIFDYEGFGESEGKPSPKDTVEDGKSALVWAHAHSPKTPLVIYAQSLGGAIALRTAIEMKEQVPLSLIVVDSTFASYQAAGRHALKKHWLTWIFQPLAYLLLSDTYAPGDKVKSLSPIPLIVMHGDKDQIIDYDLGFALFESAGEPKEFWPVPGGFHTDAFWRHGTTFRKMFLDRLDKSFAKSGEKP